MQYSYELKARAVKKVLNRGPETRNFPGIRVAALRTQIAGRGEL